MNEFVTAELDAATDPDLATDEAQRVRERLERAGLLVRPGAPRRDDRRAHAVLVDAFEADWSETADEGPRSRDEVSFWRHEDHVAVRPASSLVGPAGLGQHEVSCR